MADNLKNWILLKNAAGQAIFPQIDLRNVRAGQLLAQDKVEGLVDALNAKLATADFNNTIANYSTTEEVTQAITDAIAGVQHFAVEVVTELPAVAEAKAHTIYLVPRKAGVKSEDVYDEYILISGKFELIGNTELDLSNYYTKEDVYTKGEVDGLVSPKADKTYVDDELAKKVDKTTTVNSKALSGDIVLDGSDIALTGYTAVEGGVGIAATDTINAAFKKIDENFKTLSGDSTESLGAVVGRVSTLEGKMDAVEPKVATLESITKGYTTEGEIKADVASRLAANATVNGVAFEDDAVTIGGANIELTNYAKGAAEAVVATDTVNAAIGKLEAKVDSIVIPEDDVTFKNYAVNGVKFSEDDDNNLIVDGSIAVGTYTKATVATAIAAEDSVSAALGKLEFKADANAEDIKELQDFIQPDLFDNDNLKDYLDNALAAKVDKTTEVNGHALDKNITLGGGDIALTDMVEGSATDIVNVEKIANTDTINAAVSKLNNMATLAVYYEVIPEA